MNTEFQIGPKVVIKLPDDPTRRKQLEKKLEEYKGRLDSFQHPELQMRLHPHSKCKELVLQKLLQDSEVNTPQYSLELAQEFGDAFDVEEFADACGVINDYCETGGQRNNGGTGLPPI